MLIFPHQKSVYEEVELLANLYFAGDWAKLPIKARLNTLVIGPTGTGKSHLATYLAEKTGAYVFRESITSWIPEAARATASIEKLEEALKENEKIILFIDEFDKIIQDSSWVQHIKTEVFDILDRKVSRALEDDEKKALKYNMFILAAGTFQSEFDTESTLKGFNTDVVKTTLTTANLIKTLPRELINRFNSKIFQLNKLTKEDYLQLIENTVETLPAEYKENFQEIAKQKLENAIHAESGCRFIEEVITETLKKSPISPKPSTEEKTKKEKPPEDEWDTLKENGETIPLFDMLVSIKARGEGQRLQKKEVLNLTIIKSEELQKWKNVQEVINKRIICTKSYSKPTWELVRVINTFNLNEGAEFTIYYPDKHITKIEVKIQSIEPFVDQKNVKSDSLWATFQTEETEKEGCVKLKKYPIENKEIGGKPEIGDRVILETITIRKDSQGETYETTDIKIVTVEDDKSLLLNRSVNLCEEVISQIDWSLNHFGDENIEIEKFTIKEILKNENNKIKEKTQPTETPEEQTPTPATKS
jgi:hypothetical protein